MVINTAKGRGLPALAWFLLLAVLLLALLLTAPGGAGAEQEEDSRMLERGCERELEEGSPRLALILCERRAHMADADAQAFRNLGQAYAINGLLPEAKAAYRRAIQLGGDPEDLRAMIAVADEQAPHRPSQDPDWASAAKTSDAPPPAAAETPQETLQKAPAPEPRAEVTVAEVTGAEVTGAEETGAAGDGPVAAEGRISVRELPDQAGPVYLPVAGPEPESEPEPEPVQRLGQEPSPDAAGGPYRIQLASLTSPEAAERTARALQARYGTLLSGLSVARQTVDLPGRGRFHRVQFEGLADRAAALELCRRFKALKQDCFVPALPG